MKPACALARKAQSAPNSSGSPNRPAGICAFEIAPRRVHAHAPLPRGAREARLLPVGLERAGLDRIDRDVVARIEPRRRCEERGQAGPGARRDVEASDRRANRTRGDVDDSAELALDHAGRQRLNQRDRGQHVRFDPLEDILALDLVERLVRRAAVVVDQNVGVRAGGDQLRARRRIVQIAGDFTDRNARRLAAVRARSARGPPCRGR